jgi:hypothetical protein
MTLLPLLLFAVLPTLEVPAGETRTIDARAEYASIEVNGELTLKADVTSHGNVNVRPTGKLSIQNAHLHFIVEDSSTFIGGESEASRSDIGLWIEGRCEITGDEVTQFVEFFPSTEDLTESYGVKRFTCSETNQVRTGWHPGDHYRIISPDGSATAGPWEATGFQVGERKILPRVVNLTRTAGVSSGTGNHKAHVIVLHNGVLNAKYAEFKNLGPKGIKGRYPIHLHRATCNCDDGRGSSSIVNCSVYSTDDPSNRGIAIHDTHGHLVQGNVFYNVQGHAVFFEQPTGNEVDNQILDNITINVSGGQRTLMSSGKLALLDGVEIVPNDEELIYPWTAHYWVRPGNVIRNNLAVGGTALGMVVMPGKGGSVCEIEGQQVWGVGTWGLQNVGKTTWRNPVAINCAVAGYGSVAKWIDRGDGKPHSDAGTQLFNPVLLLNGTRPKDDKERSYRSQIFANQSPDVTVTNGTLAGDVGLAVHYSSMVRTDNAKFNTNTLASMTYYESSVLISSGEVVTKFLTDRPYPMSKAIHGQLYLVTTLNGVGVDKTFVSKAIAAQAGIAPINNVILTFANGQKEIVGVEIPSVAPAKATFPAGIKYVRLWQRGDPVPTTYPLNAMNAMLIPGTYQGVGWTAEKFSDPPAWSGEVVVK